MRKPYTPIVTNKPVTMHLNSAVYRLMQNEKNETTTNIVQRNNAIPVRDCVITRVLNTSPNEFMKLYRKNGGSADVKMWMAYPFICDAVRNDTDVKCNLTVVTGIRVVEKRKDPNEPIMVPADEPAKAIELRDAALRPYYEDEEFVLIFPETRDFFFSVSLDHVPMSAVGHYDSTKTPHPEEEAEPWPMGVDPTRPYVTPEDLELYNRMSLDFARYLKEQVPEVNWGVPGTTVNDDATTEKVMRVTEEWYTQERVEQYGFKSRSELEAFHDMMTDTFKAMQEAETQE